MNAELSVCIFFITLLEVYMNDLEMLSECRLRNLCCSQTLVQMGLYLREEENDQMVSAVGGLCGGMRSGVDCGALAGAVIMLGLFDANLANTQLISELVDWFSDRFGHTACLVILEGDMSNRIQRCPGIIKDTYLYAKGLLLEYGLIEQE